MDIKAILSGLGISFIGIWMLIFLAPINSFTQQITESVEECQSRIIQELPNTIDNTDELNKIVDDHCNPDKGSFAKVNEFAEWAQQSLVEWLIVSFFVAAILYVFLFILIGLLILAIYLFNDQ
jgi:predicted PurR-regulated permease PerM